MKRYRLMPTLYLEWFDDEALLLIGDRDVLLTLNRAGGSLFEAVAAAFAGRVFSLVDCAGWLGAQYDLAGAACRSEARKIMAFALKHHMVEPVTDRLEPEPSP